MRLFHNEKLLHESREDGTVVQVFERGDRRELRFGNRIVQSAWSTVAPDTLLLEYTRAMMAALMVCPRAEYILHLGLGGGSLARFIHRFCPNVRQRVIEINPGVIEVAYRYFDLPVSSRLLVAEGNCIDYVETTRENYDLIFVDAFHAEGPSEGVNSPSFFQLLRRRLNRNGWVVANVWGSDRERLHDISRLMNSIFPSTFAVSVHAHSNVILTGGAQERPPTPSMMRTRAAALGSTMPMDFIKWPKRFLPVRRSPSKQPEGLIAKA